MNARNCKMNLFFQAMIVALTTLILTAVYVGAQNFVGLEGEEIMPRNKRVLIFPDTGDNQDEIDDAMSDQEIARLLTEEGIPLAANVNLEFMNSNSKYTLGVDDVIDVDVMRHPEVSGSYIINNEGKMQYGFVGDIEIAGLTKSEVAEVLTDALSKFIISPEVTIIIIGYNSKAVYVVGEVGSPGKIFMRGDTITVREALVQANLPLLTGKVAKSKLITPSEEGQAVLKNVNIHKLLYEGDLRENLVMRPGDTLYIPPTFMAKTMRIMRPITEPIGSAAGTGRSIQGF